MTREIQAVDGQLVIEGDANGVIGMCVTGIIRNKFADELFLPGGEGEGIPSLFYIYLAEPGDLPPGNEHFDLSTNDVWHLSEDINGHETGIEGAELRDLVARGRVVLAKSDARRVDREFTEGDYPTGLMLGRWQVGPARFGSVNEGIFVVRDPGTGERGMATFSLSQTGGADAVRADLGAVGTVDLDVAQSVAGPDGLDRFAIVERVDADRWIRKGSGDPRTWVGPLCDVVAAVHARGEVLQYLRPETVFWSGERMVVTGRPGALAARAEKPSWGVPQMFDKPYVAPELLGMTGEATEAADVFSVTAIVAHWFSGYPFAGNDLMGRVGSVIMGIRQPWGMSSRLGAVVDQGLATDPAARPSLDELRRAFLAAF